MQRQVDAVEEVLKEIGADGRPMMMALNKVDVLSPDSTLKLPGTTAALSMVQVSALKGYGIDDLLYCISENLLLQFVALDVLIPYNRGELVALFHQYGTIEHESYEESGTHLRGYMPGNHSGPFALFQVVPQQSNQF
jgi:GTP-binding protein HflX